MSSHLKDKRRASVVTASQAWRVIHDRKKYWKEVTGRLPKFEGNEMTQWGVDHEGLAIATLEDYLNGMVDEGNLFKVHKELPIGASPDGYYKNDPVEVKCPWTQKIYPVIPEKYFYQTQIQMEVMDRPQCIFAVWTPQEFHVEYIKRDKEFIQWIIPHINEFLEYVRTDTEPKNWKKKPVYNYMEKI
jgi:hypothetical protein